MLRVVQEDTLHNRLVGFRLSRLGPVRTAVVLGMMVTFLPKEKVRIDICLRGVPFVIQSF